MASENSSTGLAGMWRPAANAVRHHWAPLLFIQVAALALVIAYFNSAGLREALVAVEQFKVRGGLYFAFATGATAGGVIPEIARLVTGRLRVLNRKWLLGIAYNALVYGLVGIEVDIFYQYQTIWFGSSRDLTTLVVKTSVDMFIFSPLVSLPTAVLMYSWRSAEFRRPSGGLREFGAYCRDKILPSLILAWIFWIPVLFCVYSLPSNLEFPFSNLAEAAWSMVFVFFNTTE